MYDLFKPIPLSLIFYSIGIIVIFVILGLLVVEYYKKKLKIKK